MIVCLYLFFAPLSLNKNRTFLDICIYLLQILGFVYLLFHSIQILTQPKFRYTFSISYLLNIRNANFFFIHNFEIIQISILNNLVGFLLKKIIILLYIIGIKNKKASFLKITSIFTSKLNETNNLFFYQKNKGQFL